MAIASADPFVRAIATIPVQPPPARPGRVRTAASGISVRLVAALSNAETFAAVRTAFNQSLRTEEGDAHGLYGKLGYRQFVWRGLHLEANADIGWDHLARGAMDGRSADGLAVVVWGLAGYQQPIGRRFYVNARGG